MTRRLICAALLAILPTTRADDQVRSVQEELRRRNIYFGDVDGRGSGELNEAVKRYQKRKGFSASGESDRDTLRSLGLAARTAGEAPPRELEWPAEPVLKSDLKIDVPAEAVQIAEETGTIAPVALAPLPSKLTARSARSKAAARAPGRAAASVRSGNSGQTEKAIRDFAAQYLRALSRDDLQDELRFYADRVDYYNNGAVDRRIIEHGLRKYYQRWPERKYTLGGLVGFRLDPSRGEIAVVFRVNFSLKNGRQQIKGSTDNQFIINAATEDPRIVSIRERRVRS